MYRGLNLWILVYFLFHPGGILCVKDLQCDFYQFTEYYACHLFGVNKNIENKNESIKFTGNHLNGNSDNSVTLLAFHETLVNFIPSNLFTQFPNLQRFQCDVCRLREIKEADFVSATKLEYFWSRIGNIEVLGNLTFQHCESLQYISLPGHKISIIEKSAFKGLKKLKELHLWHNLIKEIHQETFEDLEQLEVLDLDYNRIETIEAALFRKNSKLRQLFMSFNKLTIINSNLLDGLNNLGLIDFRTNECGDRLNFTATSNSSTEIISLFKENAGQCIEENRVESQMKMLKIKVGKLARSLMTYQKLTNGTQKLTKAIQELEINIHDKLSNITECQIPYNNEINSTNRKCLNLTSEFDKKVTHLELEVKNLRNFNSILMILLLALISLIIMGVLLRKCSGKKPEVKETEELEVQYV